MITGTIAGILFSNNSKDTSIFQGQAITATNYVFITFSNTPSTTAYGTSGSNRFLSHLIQKDHQNLELTNNFITGATINDAYSYPGNQAGSGPGLFNNSIKFGNASNAGTITLSLLYKVSKVEIVWHSWSSTTASRLTIAEVLTPTSTSFTTPTTDIVEITQTNSLTFGTIRPTPTTGDRRAIIISMKLYHNCEI